MVFYLLFSENFLGAYLGMKGLIISALTSNYFANKNKVEQQNQTHYY